MKPKAHEQLKDADSIYLKRHDNGDHNRRPLFSNRQAKPTMRSESKREFRRRKLILAIALRIKFQTLKIHQKQKTHLNVGKKIQNSEIQSDVPRDDSKAAPVDCVCFPLKYTVYIYKCCFPLKYTKTCLKMNPVKPCTLGSRLSIPFWGKFILTVPPGNSLRYSRSSPQ